MNRPCQGRAGRAALPFAAAASIMIPAPAAASETATYTYDALGRLVATSTTGTVNNGVTVTTGYDPAGNRCNYSVTGVGGVAGTAGSCAAGGGGGGTNQAPLAANDSGSMTRCVAKTFAVLANDSDPDGNLPLALVSVSGTSVRGTPSISGTSILFEPNDITGTASVTYVMRDSLGATDSAVLTITITNGTCGSLELDPGTPPEQLSAEEGDR